MVGWSQLTPKRTVVTSFTPRKTTGVVYDDNFHNEYEEGDWALSIASSKHPSSNTGTNSNTVSCALSNGEIQVYDQERLHHITTFSNNPLITDLVYGPENCVVATASDGSLTVYDLRQPQPQQQQQQGNSASTCKTTAALKGRIPDGQAALNVSLGLNGYIAAVAASKGRIHFLDLRGGCSILGSYVDSHTEDVMSLEFHPSNSSLLLSGGGDGLTCLFDTTQPSEDAALKTITNVGTPLRRVGFCSDPQTFWCLTGSETASLWNAETATCIRDFGMSTREGLSQTLGGNRKLDYLIDAYWLTNSQELLLTAGNASGDAALFRLTVTSFQQPPQIQHQQHYQQQPMAQWEPCHWMTGGHRGVVRSACHLSQSVVLTGGEDARLCEWNRVAHQAHAATTTSSSAAAGALTQSSPRGSPRGKVSMLNGSNLLASPGAPNIGGGGPLRRQRNRRSNTPY